MPLQLECPAYPKVQTLAQRSRVLAMLDAILSPEWQYRYFSYNQSWSVHQEMASMRDGAGTHYFMLFVPGGCAIKEFDLDRLQGADFDDLRFVAEVAALAPEPYQPFFNEPAFVLSETSAIAWFDVERQTWFRVEHPSAQPSSAELMQMVLGGTPESYVAWATEYFEVEVPLTAVKQLFSFSPLTPDIVHQLNADVNMDDLMEDITEIGYPVEE
ncbi:hypothetical protein [Deinococcus sonorensis]|uniref:SMI1/KNR4 family protein n=1 Tax=Deinococcus sonorensis TaxID=309891 RepID=A0ABV8Y8J2_9DEIO